MLPNEFTSTPVEFLSSTNKILNFYTFNDTIVMFDSEGYIDVIYSISNSKYTRWNATDILGCVPNLYLEYKEDYLIYQCNFTTADNTSRNHILFGVTKIY
jgi:hypothetical protein